MHLKLVLFNTNNRYSELQEFIMHNNSAYKCKINKLIIIILKLGSYIYVYVYIYKFMYLCMYV